METKQLEYLIIKGSKNDRSLDEKGRISINKAWKKEYGDEAYMIYNYEEGIVEIMPPSNFYKKADSYLKKDLSGEEIERFFYSVSMTKVDSDGRIILPRKVLEVVGVNNKVKLIGSRDSLIVRFKPKKNQK